MKERTNGTYLVLAAAIAAAAVWCSSASIPVEAVYPVERAKRTFLDKVWSRVSGMWNAASAQAENVRLRRELAALALKNGDFERIERENARLRESLGYAQSKSWTWIPAEVLSAGGPAAGSGKAIRVGKGSLSGVCVDAAVVSPEGLVGIVVSVTPHTAEVRLATDERCKVSCIVDGSPSRHGILCGGSGERLSIRHLKDAAGVQPRAAVSTSGYGGVFPKGIPVGYFVRAVAGEDSSPREGEVEPAVDFSALEDVFIRYEK
ncbi:MAG: rod shape-determining protein MreC [Kiritimatiellae bacterium]|nr:rod shape-determining protein MreC [Kiritimatiellia bacterium]